MNALLFVYGTLKRGGQLHYELAAGSARFLGCAKIQGELFHIQGESWPGAFPSVSESYIQGELYELDRPSEILKRLDLVEGCQEGLFTRELVDAWAGSGRVKAWAYFCNHPEKRTSRIAGGDFAADSKEPNLTTDDSDLTDFH